MTCGIEVLLLLFGLFMLAWWGFLMLVIALDLWRVDKEAPCSRKPNSPP